MNTANGVAETSRRDVPGSAWSACFPLSFHRSKMKHGFVGLAHAERRCYHSLAFGLRCTLHPVCGRVVCRNRFVALGWDGGNSAVAGLLLKFTISVVNVSFASARAAEALSTATPPHAKSVLTGRRRTPLSDATMRVHWPTARQRLTNKSKFCCPPSRLGS